MNPSNHDQPIQAFYDVKLLWQLVYTIRYIVRYAYMYKCQIHLVWYETTVSSLLPDCQKHNWSS